MNEIRNNAFIIGFLSLIWFIFRTGRKPSRAIYPCQQMAAVNSNIWFATYIIPILSPIYGKTSVILERKKISVLILSLISLSAVVYVSMQNPGPSESTSQGLLETEIGASLKEQIAKSTPTSDIFVVSGTTGNDDGMTRLINLLGKNGMPFYKSKDTGKNTGTKGLFTSADVIIIKVNCQWNERGGTNTDLLRNLIQALLDHPEGFQGEIIVADNGQAQYGSTGRGGSLDYGRNNAVDITQSIQKVVDSFSGYKVSTYLWDRITSRKVQEYIEGDSEDGYVINPNTNPNTGIMVSYPKFETKYGTYVSFKQGIWNPQTRKYDNTNLKIINVPVLKTHSIFGVTACVKHYMGVPSDKLSAQLGSRAHNTVGTGGMGTLMAETRFPTLNILDAIWVNTNLESGRGPKTLYNQATKVNVIAASTDPIALDYWASKNIILQAAHKDQNTKSVDPDFTEPGFFGHWLKLSMDEIIKVGHQSTINEENMNVYISR